MINTGEFSMKTKKKTFCEAKTFAQLIFKFQLIQTNVVVEQRRKNREKLESCFFHPIKWDYSVQGRN